jgi:hypothetical protein
MPDFLFGAEARGAEPVLRERPAAFLAGCVDSEVSSELEPSADAFFVAPDLVAVLLLVRLLEPDFFAGVLLAVVFLAVVFLAVAIVIPPGAVWCG